MKARDRMDQPSFRIQPEGSKLNRESEKSFTEALEYLESYIGVEVYGDRGLYNCKAKRDLFGDHHFVVTWQPTLSDVDARAAVLSADKALALACALSEGKGVRRAEEIIAEENAGIPGEGEE